MVFLFLIKHAPLRYIFGEKLALFLQNTQEDVEEIYSFGVTWASLPVVFFVK